MTESIIELIGGIFAFVLLIAVVCIITALPIMWLWNWLMPILFGLVKINFWQALGVSLFASIIFKSLPTTKNESN